MPAQTSTKLNRPEASALPVLATCGGCDCWCDDIEVQRHSGHFFFKNACDKGAAYLQQVWDKAENLTTDTPIKSTIHSWHNTNQRIAHRLLNAKRPLIMGLNQSSIQTQRFAVGIADRCNAAIDIVQPNSSIAKTIAFQQTGEVACSWGEVKNRSDVIIYWRCHPESAPRFRQRYGDLASKNGDSYFLGNRHPKVFVVGDDETIKSWKAANSDTDLNSLHTICTQADDQTIFQTLLLEQLGKLESKEALASIGDAVAWQDLLTALQTAQFSAFVVGKLYSTSPSATGLTPSHQSLNRLVMHYNQGQRCVWVPWPGNTGNSIGAQAVMTWRTGYPFAVDFLQRFPRFDPVGNRWQSIIESKNTDYVLVVGDSKDIEHTIAATTAKALSQIQTDQIGGQRLSENITNFIASDAFGCANPNLPETVCRPDGVFVPVRLPKNPTIPSQSEVLGDLYRQIEDLMPRQQS